MSAALATGAEMTSGHAAAARRLAVKGAASVVCIALCLALSACADGPNAPYPSLARINPIENALTPEEQAKARKALEEEQRNHGREAKEDIAKR